MEYKYGKKLEVRNCNFMIEVYGKIPKSTPMIVNMNTDDDRFNVRINGVPFNNLTTTQLDLLVNSAEIHLDITGQDNPEPVLSM